MPEQLTKHPEVTLQVLKSSGAVCAEGVAPEILTRCPAERFCKLPGGEICVYGLADAARMTQPTAADWRQLVQAVDAGAAPAPAAPGAPSAWLYGGTGLLVGLALGTVAAAVLFRRSAMRRRRARHPQHTRHPPANEHDPRS
jgi:hypothetical protein